MSMDDDRIAVPDSEQIADEEGSSETQVLEPSDRDMEALLGRVG